MKKPLLIILGLLIAVPVLLLIALVIFIDPLARAGVEQGASNALKVPARLKGAAIHFSGKATLTGFEVANPPGYAEPRSVSFQRVDADVRPGSLLQDVLEVGELTVVKPELTLEFLGARSNWSVLMNNLSAGKPESRDEKPAAAGKKYIIHRLRIEEAAARFRSDLTPGGATSVTLPAVELENIGTAEGGATLGQVLDVILHRLGDSALKAGQGILPAELLNHLGDTLKKGLKELENLPSNRVDELKKNIPDKDKVEKGVKDFLRRN